ncbi:ACP S-malonyltransferase [Lactiplantibacillus plantarum]
MKKFGVIFCGQGVQKVGLGSSLYSNTITSDFLLSLDKSANFNLKKLLTQSEKILVTEYAQPALLAYSLSLFNFAASKLKKIGDIESFAGLSLGEYTALGASGVLLNDQLMSIVHHRGKLMQESCINQRTTLIAVSGTNVYEILSKKLEYEGNRSFYIANINSPTQIVIGTIYKDERELIKSLMEDCASLVCTPLKVDGAFHTPFMDDANQLYRKDILTLTPNFNNNKVYSNYSGTLYNPKNFFRNLSLQMNHSTHMSKIIKSMGNDGINCLITFCPNRSLMKIVKQNLPSMNVINISSPADIVRKIG